jgi:hypothetical protein
LVAHFVIPLVPNFFLVIVSLITQAEQPQVGTANALYLKQKESLSKLTVT